MDLRNGWVLYPFITDLSSIPLTLIVILSEFESKSGVGKGLILGNGGHQNGQKPILSWFPHTQDSKIDHSNIDRYLLTT